MTSFDQDPKYSKFNIHSTSYKQIDDHGIAADVFIPKALVASLLRGETTTKRPIIVRFHGGGLFTGMSLYPEWFPPYLLEYASRHSVPLVSADYRLMPECTGLDILADLSSFFEWVQNGLQVFISTLYPSLRVNTDCILAEGESAGGYLVVQAALARLPGLRAIIAAFPMLDLRAPYFTEKHDESSGEMRMLSEEIITNMLKSIKKGDVVSSILPPTRLDLGAAIIQHGRFEEFLGEDSVLYPLERVKVLKHPGSSMPRLWIYHGKQDSGIPAEGSVNFVAEATGLWTEPELRLDLPDGDHGIHPDSDLDTTDWSRDGLAWVMEPWLAGLGSE